MNTLAKAAVDVCVVAVIAAAVRLILPQNKLGKSVRAVCDLTVAAAAAGIVFAVFGSGIALPDMGAVSSADFSSAAAYIYDRTEQSAADALREKAEKTLSELGIFDADISIDFDRSGAYPQVQSVKDEIAVLMNTVQA